MDMIELARNPARPEGYTARHLYVRREGQGFAVRCRNTFDVHKAVEEGSRSGIVLTIIEGKPGVYDMVKCEDAGLLTLMMKTYKSCPLKRGDDYLYFHEDDDADFQKSWEIIP